MPFLIEYPVCLLHQLPNQQPSISGKSLDEKSYEVFTLHAMGTRKQIILECVVIFLDVATYFTPNVPVEIHPRKQKKELSDSKQVFDKRLRFLSLKS